MIRHLNKNKTWVIIGLAQVLFGILVLFNYQDKLDHRIPPFLGMIDDAPIGMAYIIIGILVIINFIWDFYWYYIRVVLIVLSEMMFMLIFTSYLFSGYLTHSFSATTLFSFLFAMDVIWTAYLEPPYKLKGGHDKWI